LHCWFLYWQWGFVLVLWPLVATANFKVYRRCYFDLTADYVKDLVLIFLLGFGIAEIGGLLRSLLVLLVFWVVLFFLWLNGAKEFEKDIIGSLLRLVIYEF